MTKLGNFIRLVYVKDAKILSDLLRDISSIMTEKKRSDELIKLNAKNNILNKKKYYFQITNKQFFLIRSLIQKKVISYNSEVLI